MDEFRRADVDAARRLRREQDLRVARDLAGEQRLLQIAAGERAGARLRAGGADVEALDLVGGEAADGAAVEDAARLKGGASIQGSAIDSGSGSAPIMPVVSRSSGTRPILQRLHALRRGMRDDLAGDRDRAPLRPQARRRRDRRARAGRCPRRRRCRRSRRREASSETSSSATLPSPRVETWSSASSGAPGVDRRLLRRHEIAAAHQPRQLRLRQAAVVVALGDDAAVAHDGDAVGDLDHLAELVGDEDHAHALAPTMERSARKSPSVSCGVSVAVGSSRTRMRAPRTSDLAISTRCCSPTERSPTRRSGSSSR